MERMHEVPMNESVANSQDIPLTVEGWEIQKNKYVTSLAAGDIDMQFLTDIQKLGYEAHVTETMGKPYLASIYQTRRVKLPSFPMDPNVRQELIAGQYKATETEATSVDRFFTGGQFGGTKGGIYVEHAYGPIIVSTRGEETLQQLIDHYKEITHNNPAFHLDLFIEAVKRVFGNNINHKNSRIPVQVLSQKMTGLALRYIPDCHIVIDDQGFQIPFKTDDSKIRIAKRWDRLMQHHRIS